MEVSGQPHASAALPPEKEPTKSIGWEAGWAPVFTRIQSSKSDRKWNRMKNVLLAFSVKNRIMLNS